jgi:hypothetical protein
MSTTPDRILPNNTYPRDVTSPGPDQRTGVIPSQRTTTTPSEVSEKGDEPKPPTEER